MTSIFEDDLESTQLKRIQDLIKLYCTEARKAGQPATAETYARATYLAVRKACEESGQKPDIETKLVKPGEQAYDGAGDRWLVMWEAGPYQWAIDTSMMLTMHLGLVEPYYSFDLTFYPGEHYN